MSASERTAVALSKKDLLEKLTVDELRDGIDRCEIPVRDHRSKKKQELVDALAKRGWVEIWKIPPGLSLDRLKKLCRALGLDDSGRRKTDLAARLGQPCLTVDYPAAWEIIHGGKDIENRVWSTKFRGRFWIHAGKAKAPDQRERAFRVIGSVELVKVVTKSASRSFCGPYGFKLRKPEPLAEPIPLRGRQRFFSAAGLPPLP